jgi:hypothetical protein
VFVTQLSSNAEIPVDEVCGLRQIAFPWVICYTSESKPG